MSEEYVFTASGDACEVCQGLDGTTSTDAIGRPHESCQCTIEAECQNTYDAEAVYSDGTVRNGMYCVEWTAEVSVECWDGTMIGGTIPIDLGCFPLDTDWSADAPNEYVRGMFAEEGAGVATELAESCPDCKPPLVG